MKIYVASSWKNNRQPILVEALRNAGHLVYDFKNPEPGDDGFSWKEVDGNWEDWTPAKFRINLEHSIANDGFEKDKWALDECDACVLILPCGKSAHLELGYACGHRKFTIVLMESKDTPELMYKLVDSICVDIDEVLEEIKAHENTNIMTNAYQAKELL